MKLFFQKNDVSNSLQVPWSAVTMKKKFTRFKPETKNNFIYMIRSGLCYVSVTARIPSCILMGSSAVGGYFLTENKRKNCVANNIIFRLQHVKKYKLFKISIIITDSQKGEPDKQNNE